MKAARQEAHAPLFSAEPAQALVDDFSSVHNEGDTQFAAEIQTAMANVAGITIGERLGDGERYSDLFESLALEYQQQQRGESFTRALDAELKEFLQRPTPLLHAARLSQQLGGAKIFLKREDCSSGLSQLQIAVTGQALLARRLGRRTLVAFSRNGFSGQVVASIAKRMGMRAIIFVDPAALTEEPGHILRIQQLGAHVEAPNFSNMPSGDLRVLALEYCLCDRSSFLVMGLEGAPQPYPRIAMDCVSAIGREALAQLKQATGKLPDMMVASMGDEADAIGFLAPALAHESIKLAQVQTWGIDGVSAQEDDSFFRHYLAQQAARKKSPGNDANGIRHPSLQREHAWLKSSGRVEYPAVRSVRLRKVIRDMVTLEHLSPALTTAQALSYAVQKAAQMRPEQSVVVLVAEHMERTGVSTTRH